MRPSLVIATLLSLALASSASAQVCEWTGQVTVAELRVTDSSPLSVVPLTNRRAIVSPIALRVFSVQTIDDGPALRGTTRDPIAIAVSGQQVFAGIATVASGTLVDDLTIRRSELRGTLAIDEDVWLDRMPLTCEVLGVATEIAAAPMSGPNAPGPRWHQRSRSVRVRSRPETEAPWLTLRVDGDRTRHVLVERDRRFGWVRIEVRFAHAIVAGWVPDTDLVAAGR